MSRRCELAEDRGQLNKQGVPNVNVKSFDRDVEGIAKKINFFGIMTVSIQLADNA